MLFAIATALALVGCPRGKDPLPVDGIDGVPVLDGVVGDGLRRDGPRDQGPQPDGAATGCFTVGPWASSAPIPDGNLVTHPLPAFASGGYFYVHTVRGDGTPAGEDRRLYSASPQADGSLGAWQIAAADHDGGANGFAAIDVAGEPYHFRNGHIARYRIAGGKLQGIELLEESVDASFGGNRYLWDSAVLAQLGNGSRYVFHLGGFDLASASYRNAIFRSSVPVARKFTGAGLIHPAARPGKAAFFSPTGASYGFLFTGEGNGRGLWRARVEADGALGPFARLPDLPAGSSNGRGDLLCHGRTLFSIRGSKVYRCVLDAAGGATAWQEAPELPEPQVEPFWPDAHLEAASSGVIGARVYVTGKQRVHHAPFVADPRCGGA